MPICAALMTFDASVRRGGVENLVAAVTAVGRSHMLAGDRIDRRCGMPTSSKKLQDLA